MRLFKKKAAGRPPLARVEALTLTPVKNSRITQERLPGGEVLICYTAPLRPLPEALMRYLGRGRSRTVRRRLQLDTLGSEVWGLIDGRRSVSRLIELFAQTHKVSAQEAEIAVTQFIRSLGRRGLIGLK
jgi:Coenzyme PQQ synthesis protein D (PqqD)